MRLNKQKKNLVGPASLMLALGLIGAGVAYPNMDGAYAQTMAEIIASYNITCTPGGEGEVDMRPVATNPTNSDDYAIATTQPATQANGNGHKDAETAIAAARLYCSKLKTGDAGQGASPVAFFAVQSPDAFYMVPLDQIDGIIAANGGTKTLEEAIIATFSVDNKFVASGDHSEQIIVKFDIGNMLPNSDSNSQNLTVNFMIPAALAQTDGEGRVTIDFEVVKKIFDDTRENLDMDILFDVQQFLEIVSSSDTLDIATEVTPSGSDGTFTSGKADFTVSGNNAKGFSVYVYAADDAAKNMISATDATVNTAMITPIAANASGTAYSAFGANKWGFSVAEQTVSDGKTVKYNPITTDQNENSLITSLSSNKPASKSGRLFCGASVDTSLPADTYQTSLTISAVNNPDAVAAQQ